MRNNGVNHLALILDGNRRWAKKNGVPTIKGYQAGLLALEHLTEAAIKRDIKYITAYCFSTENWGRSKLEVSALIKLFGYGIKKYTDILNKNDMQLKVIGRLNDFPKAIKSSFDKSVHKLKNNKQGVLTLALSYGGRDEIIRAIQKSRNIKGKIDEKTFSLLLDTTDLPDPDLIIRTGGVKRLSNFLTWQSAYSELYFTNVLCPDFNTRHLDLALRNFKKRKRNFGK